MNEELPTGGLENLSLYLLNLQILSQKRSKKKRFYMVLHSKKKVWKKMALWRRLDWVKCPET